MNQRELAPRFEDYLETIYLLERGKGVARVKEISEIRNVKMPTVTEVLKRLSKRGFVIYEPYGHVKTTEKGKKYAERVYRRHRILKAFMKEVLLLPEDESEYEGCLLEHYVSDKALNRIKILTDLFNKLGLKGEMEKLVKD